MNSNESKPLAAVSQALRSLFRRQKPQDEHEHVNPVEEVREGLKDIKSGRVREIKNARDILKDK